MQEHIERDRRYIVRSRAYLATSIKISRNSAGDYTRFYKHTLDRKIDGLPPTAIISQLQTRQALTSWQVIELRLTGGNPL